MDVSTHAESALRLLRDSATRFSQQGGWKRHVPWLVSEIGRTLRLSAAFLYKNYPDSDGELTAVRLSTWNDPLDFAHHTAFDDPVIKYGDALWSRISSRLRNNEPVFWHDTDVESDLTSILQQHEIECLMIVPVFAGDDWWGLLGGFCASDCVHGCAAGIAEKAVAVVLDTVAVQLGSAVRSASVEQALRWSERLHRIQRDIALAGAKGGSDRHSLSELLSFVCELGGFDAGSVELVDGDRTTRIAAQGDPPPQRLPGPYVDVESIADITVPVYLDSDELSGIHGGGDRYFHSSAILPIVHQGSVSGLLQLYSANRTHVPESVRRSLEAVATEISVLTTQVRTNEQMRIINDRYRRAVTDGQIGVWEFDPETGLVSMDPPTPAMFGLPVDQRSVPMSRVLSVISPEQRKRIRTLLRSGYSKTDRVKIECLFSLPSGFSRWFAIRASWHADADARVRVTGTAIDITQQRADQEELQNAQMEADESNRAKSEFLARMSHELRTPLNAILGHTQILQQSADSRSERPLESIQQSARHLMSMVENILGQNTLESNRLTLRPGPVNVERLVSTVADEVAVLFADSAVEFRVRYDGGVPSRLRADATRLRQVLLNLIGNAAKFTRKGRVELRLRWRASRLRFAICDTGIGIPPTEYDSIFVPFRNNQETGSGTGLGLSISSGLVKLMGSRIRLKSRVGFGTVFWFSLPTVDNALSDSATSTAYGTEPSTNEWDATPLPPTEELDMLASLVQIGDIAGVREYAHRRLRSDTATAFYNRILRLASSFRLRDLRELVERSRNE
jgi:signal transduction histidine kinase